MYVNDAKSTKEPGNFCNLLKPLINIVTHYMYFTVAMSFDKVTCPTIV